MDSELAARVAALVGSGTDVLGLLCARRGFLEALANKGCHIVAIEDDPAAAAMAVTSSDRVLTSDVERLDLLGELRDQRFDALVVDLGYLSSPTAALTILKNYLRDAGALVVVAPNATFARTALALLAGDDPHCRPADSRNRLRRYTHTSLEQLLDEQELVLGALERHSRPASDTVELHAGAGLVRPALLQALLDDGEAQTEEFVFRAHVLAVPGLRWVQARMRELVEANAAANREIASLGSRMDGLREVARSVNERESERRQLLLDAHQQLLDRDVELAAAGALVQERTLWAKDLDRELNNRNELIRELQATVEERTEWAQRLDRELAERSEWAQQLDREVIERNDLVRELQGTFQERTDWAQRLEKELAERDNLIQQLIGRPRFWTRARAVFLWLRSPLRGRETHRA